MFMRYRGGGIGHSANPLEARTSSDVGTEAAELAETFVRTREPTVDDTTPRLPNGELAVTNDHILDPGQDDGGEAPPEDDPEELVDEAQEYGYAPMEDQPGDDGEEEGEVDGDELGPEDSEGEDGDDASGTYGYAPY